METDSIENVKQDTSSYLELLDRKLRFFIVGVIVFIIYLILSTQPVSNSQQVCKIDNGTCLGKLIDEGKGIIKCCQNALLYPANKDVPKGFISWGKGIILIIAYLLTIVMIIASLKLDRPLNIKKAIEITNLYMQKLYKDYEYSIGPVCKLRHVDEYKRSFKWVIGVKLRFEDEPWQYYQAEVYSNWKTNIPMDHFIGMKKRDTELRADVVDKEETGDIHYIYDPRTRMERMYKDATKTKSN